MVNDGDIPNLWLKITPRQVHVTRSTLVKPRGEVGEGQKRVWNTQHSTSVLINHIAVGRKPHKAWPWGAGQRDGIWTAGRVMNDARDGTWQNVW